VLGLSWSLAFAARLPAALAEGLRRFVVWVSKDVDCTVAHDDVYHDEAIGAWWVPGAPYAVVNLPGIMVVFKPKDWEVNRGDPEVYR